MRNVAAWERIPARAARYAPAPPSLDARLLDALSAQGIDNLYTHQAAAIESTQRGENPVVVTSTASGKTLGYNLPQIGARSGRSRHHQPGHAAHGYPAAPHALGVAV